MAITSATIANTLQMRAELERYVIESELHLAKMWSTAWREVADEYALAVADLVDMAEKGDWPTRTQVLRAQRVDNALKVTLDQMSDLVPASATAMQDNLATITASAQHWSERIVRSQLPTHGISQTWSRVDVGAMDAIVKRSTGRIHSLTMPLTRDMVTQMKATLIRGVAVGENPRVAARQIMRRCEQTFSGGRARALNIARTELNDAHRQASLRSRSVNSDIVKGWRWHCTFSPRTCPSCLAQHGSLHKADELGPLDHQQGRCTSIPVTKSWRELGIDQDEAADEFPDARAWFNRQPRETKLRIMGAERLRRLEDGRLSWDDLSQLRHTNGWRDSFNVAPLERGRFGGGTGSNDAAAAANALHAEAAKHANEITGDVQAALPEGAELVGLANRVKTPQSLARKIQTDSDRDGISVDAAASKISDSVRFTQTSSPDRMAADANQTLNGLRNSGYEVSRVKNTWQNDQNNPYQGVNVKLTHPSGLQVEMQFHTPESLEVKNEIHVLYDKQRVLAPHSPEWDALNDEMNALSAGMPVPTDVHSIH